MTSKKKNIIIACFLPLILIVIIFIAAFKNKRYDLTDDQRYSLKQPTKDLFKNKDFNGKVYCRVYFEDENLPAYWKKFHNEIRAKLEDYKDISKGKFEFTFEKISKDEEALKEIDAQLRDKGITPIEITTVKNGKPQNLTLYVGATLSYPDKEDVAINFVSSSQHYRGLTAPQTEEILNEQVELIEYNISSSIKNITTFTKPRIGFLQGHGELSGDKLYYAKQALENYYVVEEVSITQTDSTGNKTTKLNALDNLDALIIAKPELPFNKDGKENYVLDQFIMNGGKVIWCIDPIKVEVDSFLYNGYTSASTYPDGRLNEGKTLGLYDQLFTYGCKIENSLVLESPGHEDKTKKERNLHCAPTVIYYKGRPLIYDWMFYPLASKGADLVSKQGTKVVKNNHPISAYINPVKFEYAGYVNMLDIKDPKIKKTVLLETNDSSKALNPPIDIDMRFVMMPNKYNNIRYPLAVLLEGEFNSMFKNKMTPALVNNKDFKFKESVKENKMIVISDGDIFRNDLYYQGTRAVRIPLDVSVYKDQDVDEKIDEIRYGNKDFLLNSVQYLLDDQYLLQSRKVIQRKLDGERIEKYKSFWQRTNITIPLLILALFGLIQFFIRKNRFAK